jgi:hypothetical protein
MRSSIGVSLLLLLLGAASGCERLGNAGEQCAAPAISESDYANTMGGDCATGLICAPDRSPTADYSRFETASCRELCASSADCAEGYTCRGVTGAEYRQACMPIVAD